MGSDLQGPRYIRIGPINQGRPCDTYLEMLFHLLPGEQIPKRWVFKTPGEFVDAYGAGIRWAANNYYSTLLYNGSFVLRMWTNLPTTTWVDVSDALAEVLKDHLPIQSITAGRLQQAKPLKKQFKVESEDDLLLLVAGVRQIYGLGNQ